MNLRRLLSFQPFAPWVFLTACAVALAAVVLIVMSVVNGAREAAQTKVDAEMSQARAKATAEAGAVVDRAHDFQSGSEALSRENADAFRQAPGADQRLDPRLNDAGRRGLCQRASLRRTAECVQLLGPVEPPR
jgi:hypothetical protein